MPYELEGAVLARMYDADYAALRTPSGDVDFYVDRARESGGPVLELGCGTGRILVPVAEAGVAITGLDSSPAMLDRARARLARRDVAAELVEGDMRDFALARRFALVTIPFRALSHVLETDGQVAVFAGVRRHLAPGGRLVFDLFQPNPAYLTEPRPEKLDVEREETGCVVRRFSAAVPHRATQTLEVTFRWEIESPDGGIERASTSFRMRWFFRFEIEHLLARAGLELETVLGGFDGSAFADDSAEMIFVARAAG